MIWRDMAQSGRQSGIKGPDDTQDASSAASLAFAVLEFVLVSQPLRQQSGR
jgi:hypothetical protein